MCLLLGVWALSASAALLPLRAPATPLIVNNPYLSLWSPTDKLTDDWSANGPNGDRQRIAGMLSVDGVAYAFLGPTMQTNHSTGVLNGTDNAGGDLPNMPVTLSEPDWRLCQQLCVQNPDCGGWAAGGTAVKRFGCEGSPICWLKGTPGPMAHNDCRISQIIDRGGSALPVNKTLTQVGVQIFPTTTVYTFSSPEGVSLEVRFWTPVLPDNLEAMARPATYVTFSVWSGDGRSHDVRVYFEVTADPVVASSDTLVDWARGVEPDGSAWMRVGAHVQKIFSETGDRPNWGFLYLGFPTDAASVSCMAAADTLRSTFALAGFLPPHDDAGMPSPAGPVGPALAFVHKFTTTAQPQATTVVVAIDLIYSINFFEQWMPPYWRRNGAQGPQLVSAALADAARLAPACNTFDSNLLSRISSLFGDTYATLCALAYRQSYASTDIVWNEITGTHWQFLKEISSGSCLSTVDVIYPAAPLYLLMNPDLLYRLLVPLLEYANNATYIAYNLPWAPHHLGTYPIGNLAPDQQEQMPVEETANMLLMLAAIARHHGSADFIDSHYWPLLRTWGDYLVSTALDPGNQLCTDDFEGPSPHNANLAMKGIVGLEGYAILLQYYGDAAAAAHYHAVAADYASRWPALALDPSGTHYKLEYDKGNTWSTKYNLFFHTLLNMTIFPPSVIGLENTFYAQKQNPYGLPLDNRADFAKTDWELWAAASMPPAQAQQLFNAVFRFANTTSGRVPFSDWYETSSGDLHGFRCRAVIGGVFAPMLVAAGV